MERPDEVPATATFDDKAGYWRDGDATSPVERLWSSGGSVMLEAPRKAGKLHGEVRWKPMIEDDSQLESRVAIASALGLPEGPTNGQIATFVDGQLVKVRFRPGFDDWYKDDVVAQLVDGKLHGELEWRVGSTNGQPLFSHEGTVIRPDQFKLPKPWPKKLVAKFDRGRLIGHAMFDAQGAVVAGDKPIDDWGEHTTPAVIAGYIERGDLVADAKRFFPKAAKAATDRLPKKIDKLAKLPAAKTLEAAIRKKQLPVMGIAIDFSDFGVDCEQAKLDGASDARYVGIGCDGSGDMYLLDTSTGKVHIYRHEESILDRQAFDSLDAFAFALLRVEAAMRDLIPKPALKKLLVTLGIDAGASLLS